jgi:hypothetical protein
LKNLLFLMFCRLNGDGICFTLSPFFVTSCLKRTHFTLFNIKVIGLTLVLIRFLCSGSRLANRHMPSRKHIHCIFVNYKLFYLAKYIVFRYYNIIDKKIGTGLKALRFYFFSGLIHQSPFFMELLQVIC